MKTTKTTDDQLAALRRAGYKPHARMSIMGRDLELISYPFPRDAGDGSIGCMVREPDDPTTLAEWLVPDHVIAAACWDDVTDDMDGTYYHAPDFDTRDREGR